MATSKQNFLAAHWDYLVVAAGLVALALAIVFLLQVIAVTPEEAQSSYRASLESRIQSVKKKTVVPVDRALMDAALKGVEKPPQLAPFDPKKGSFLSSESLVFCQKGDADSKQSACGRPIPMGSEVCPYCKMKQNVVKIEADTDHDGIPNDWEVKFGLNPNDPSDAMKDADGDGFTNSEEYQANTDPKDKASHPDYLNFLALNGQIEDTRLDFYFKLWQPIPNGYRFTFQRLVKTSKNAQSTYSAMMNTEIATTDIEEKNRDKSGWKVIGFDKKEESIKVPGSNIAKKIDSSKVEIERLSDGKKIKLTLASPELRRLDKKGYEARIFTALESRIELVWNRGKGKTLKNIAEGSTFELNERKYRVTKLAKTDSGCEVTVLDLATQKEKIIK